MSTRKPVGRKVNLKVVESRVQGSYLAKWLDNPNLWNKNEFAKEVKKSMYDAYGVEVKFDDNLITVLADQFDTYVRATHAINTEGMIEYANNGARMSNPNQKVRDTALARVMQILTMLGLVPSGRPKRSSAPTEVDDLLGGVKVA